VPQLCAAVLYCSAEALDRIAIALDPLEQKLERSEGTTKTSNPLKPNDLKKRRTAQLTSRCCAFYIFIQQIYVLNILNMLHNLRFFPPSKCRLFHNATFFGSCIIHILNTGCAKI